MSDVLDGASIRTEDGWTIYGPPVRGRGCGSCSACCTIVPVVLPEGRKGAGVRCPHQRAKGCGIYERRPAVCRSWSCKWLIDPDTAGMGRPDHTHYVIDPMLDTAIAEDRPVEVIQIWNDPAYPDAHRDPALRAWLELMFLRHGLFAFVRFGSQRGLTLVPPGLSATGAWQEFASHTLHSPEEMTAQLKALGARRLFGPVGDAA